MTNHLLFNDISIQGNQELEISEIFSVSNDIVLHHGDTQEFVKTIDDHSIQLVITSPPYNVGKNYELEVSIEQYLAEQRALIDQLVRVMAENGSLCWQVGNYVKNGEVFPLDIFYYDLFKRHGLKLRNRIIWHFGHGLHASKRFSGRYETILWFTKSDHYTFNLDPVRIPSKYPGKRHYKGKNIGQPSCNPLGKNPSDIWQFVAQEWDRELWDIPNVKSNHPEKTIHPCQFPIELVERCILALTNPGDTVFDPYCGVASTLIAGIKHQRQVVGCEKELEFVNLGRQRIHDFINGKLKLRPLGTPIHQPTGREKVSQIPLEWTTS